jgi:hypothetical protein
MNTSSINSVSEHPVAFTITYCILVYTENSHISAQRVSAEKGLTQIIKLLHVTVLRIYIYIYHYYYYYYYISPLHYYYDQAKEDEMDTACSTHVRGDYIERFGEKARRNETTRKT